MAFTQVIKTLGSVMAGMKTAVDTWLSQNITNPSNPPLDRSLSLSNACAPADIVGGLKNAFIEEIKEVITTTPTYSFTDGYKIGTSSGDKGQIIEGGAYSVTGEISTDGVTEITFYYSGNNPYATIALYKSDNSCLNTYSFPASSDPKTLTLTDTAYVRYSTQTSRKNNPKLSFKSISYGKVYQKIDTKIDINQGIGNAGKYLKIGNDGNLSPVTYVPGEELVIVQSGWSGATTKPQSYYANCKGINFAQGDTVTPKSGYECAIMNASDGTVRQWFSTAYTFGSACSNYGIVIRKTNGSAEINLDYDGYKLTDYITENYDTTNSNYKGFAIGDPTKSMLLSGISRTAGQSKWYDKKVAFIGDSITAGAQAGTAPLYYEIVNNKIHFYSVTVNAVAGSGYSGIGTDKTPIITRAANLSTDLDLIIIFAGTNDFGHGVPIGTLADTTDVSFCGAVAGTFIEILANNPSVRLAVMTPLHRASGTYDGEDDANSQGKVLLDYVDALRKVCDKYSIPIIDTYLISGINPNISEIGSEYFADGLHINGDGHAILGERILPYFELI